MSEFVVKRHGDVVHGPGGEMDQHLWANSMNAAYQTDEYRVEEWNDER